MLWAIILEDAFILVFILLLRDFNVCTVWHVSGASRPLSFVNKKKFILLLISVMCHVLHLFKAVRR